MARPPRRHVPRAFFHVTQRGNDRRPIFLNDQDRLRYLGVLADAMSDGGELLHAYCLMSNHSHLVVQTSERSLSVLMHRLGTRHARYFNDRWSRSGHLFQGRFHASFVPSDPHLLIVLRYVHLNPLRAGLVSDPVDHRWSSHRAYLGAESPPWLCTRHILGLIHHERVEAGAGYASLMRDGLDEGIPPMLSDAAEEVRLDADLGGAPPSLERILQEVAAHSGCSVNEICRWGAGHRQATARSAVVFLARSLGQVRLSELSRVLGRDPATLHNGVARRLHRPSNSWQEILEGVRRSLDSNEEKRKA